eukprot:11040582-Heterocapsa_arctica.AAC.1
MYLHLESKDGHGTPIVINPNTPLRTIARSVVERYVSDKTYCLKTGKRCRAAYTLHCCETIALMLSAAIHPRHRL